MTWGSIDYAVPGSLSIKDTTCLLSISSFPTRTQSLVRWPCAFSSPLCKWVPCGKVLANGIWAEVVWKRFLGKVFKMVGQNQLAVSFLAFALSLGWPTVLVCPILWGFQRHGTFSLKAWRVPGEVGKLSLCLPFLQQNVNVKVGF